MSGTGSWCLLATRRPLCQSDGRTASHPLPALLFSPPALCCNMQDFQNGDTGDNKILNIPVNRCEAYKQGQNKRGFNSFQHCPSSLMIKRQIMAFQVFLYQHYTYTEQTGELSKKNCWKALYFEGWVGD